MLSLRWNVPLMVGLGAILAVGGWLAPGFALRWSIASELQPIALQNCTLQRFGSADDGGYLMCANLPAEIDAAYSYGVGKNDDWGCQVSRERGVPIHQYDCFNPARPACDGGRFVFHHECVGDTREQDAEGRAFDTFANHMSRNGDAGTRVWMKIDIEGAEWDALLATPDALLADIPQLAMELHGYDDPKILDALRKLKRHFYVVNLNHNNWSCRGLRAWPMKAWAYQVLLVNRKIAVPDPHAPMPAPASALNARDAPHLAACR